MKKRHLLLGLTAFISISLEPRRADAAKFRETEKIDKPSLIHPVLVAGRRGFRSSRTYRSSKRRRTYGYSRGTRYDRDGDGISCERGCRGRSGGRIGGNTFGRYRAAVRSYSPITPASTFLFRPYGQRGILRGRPVYWDGFTWLPVIYDGTNQTERQQTVDSNQPLEADSRNLLDEFMEREGYPLGRPGYAAGYVIPLCAGGREHIDNITWFSQEVYSEKQARDRRSCESEKSSRTRITDSYTTKPIQTFFRNP